MSLSSMSLGMHALWNGWRSDAPAHQGITTADLVNFASQGGSTIIRVPLDLSVVGPNGFPQYYLNDLIEWLSAAQQNGVKIIFEPGQTPPDLSNDGTPQGNPNNFADLYELADRFAIGIEQVYNSLGAQYSDTIQGWEVGNEPNLSYDYTEEGAVSDSSVDHRFFSMTIENAEWYAEYLHAVNEAVAARNISVNGNPIDISIIGAGIAHNDYAYMDAMFARLQQLGSSVDAFSIHPYTTNTVDNFGNQIEPESGRPTDWIEYPTNYSESWDYYYGFQGAIYGIQSLMNSYGFSGADLWMTEFGVPSYLGFRNAGSDGYTDANGIYQAGVLDQARWYAEAFGVIDSWDNSNLKGMMAHHVLDNQTYEYTSWYNAYDSNPNNDGTWLEGEDAFGLFHEVNGEIVSKPAAWLMASITSGNDFQFFNIESIYTQSVLDYSSFLSSTGLTSGVVALSHSGDDTITGSAFDDSIFAGNGNDVVNGGNGADRLYGGQGNDALYGEAGNDDIYGNTGDDLIWTGAGANRVDGGTGWDRLILSNNQSAYSWSGDGVYLNLSGAGESVEAINLEVIEFADGSEVVLNNWDINRGNGGFASSGTPNQAPNAVNDEGFRVPANDGQLTIDVLSNDSDPENDSLTITQINEVDLDAGGWTGYIAGVGVIQRNPDNTLTIYSLDAPVDPFSFTYTVSDGTDTSVATVTGTIGNANQAPVATDDSGFQVTANNGQLTIDVLANDSDPENDDLTITQINGVDFDAAGWTGYIAGVGVVQRNSDNTLTIHSVDAPVGPFSFTYTVSDGTDTSVATVSGAIVSGDINGTASADNPLNGTSAADTINGLGGNDKIYGKAGDDVINGDDGNDTIFGEAGDDTLNGGSGADKLRGGTGSDVLDGGEGKDFASYLDASSGVRADIADTSVNTGDAAGDVYVSIERLQGSDFDDILGGDNNANLLAGQNGNDSLYGNGGNDVLRGGEGADLLDGGDGRDRAQYSTASEGVLVDLFDTSFNTGDAAGDVFVSIEDLQGSKHNDTLLGDTSKNHIWGNSGDDQIYAWDGDDKIFGQHGNDTLFGENGKDKIDGGTGDDFLMGGTGEDVFIFNGSSFGTDGIGDFEVGVDDIRFHSNTGVIDYADVQNSMYQQGGNTIIDVGPSSLITLYDISVASLGIDDFQFV